jgi:hypothetical protein
VQIFPFINFYFRKPGISSVKEVTEPGANPTIMSYNQCCQMLYFQTKNPNLCKFGKVLQWKMLVLFVSIWSILRPNGLFYGPLVHFVLIWNIFTVLICCTEKNLATLLTTPQVA